MNISICEDGNYWNQNLETQENATYAHLHQWKSVIKNAYGLKCHYLILTEKEVPVSFLPLTICKSLSGKKKGVSMAFNSYAGIAGKTSPEIREAFKHFVKSSFGLNHLEIRTKLQDAPSSEYTECTMVLDLLENEDDQWKKLSSKTRVHIRKAEANEITIKKTNDTTNFYKVYSLNMGRLGTPIHPRTFFDEILHQFKSTSHILEVYLHDKPIAAMILIEYKKTVTNLFASTLSEYNKLYPNMLMYWQAIKTSTSNGFKYFDMGRSQIDSGTFIFKKKWGALPQPILYENLFSNTDNSIDFYRSNKAKKIANIWKSMPSSIQLFLGPKLRKYIP